MKNEIALLFISNHFREQIRLDEIAEQTGLSKYHFHRLFVKENNCTPQAYLEKIRMEYASHFLILYPNTSITEVAFESGYSFPACFNRAFKKHYSISPTQFRTNSKLQKPIKKIKYNPISVDYFATKTIEVQKVQLNYNKLNHAYQSIIKNSDSQTGTIGFYLDVPFHVPLEDCRHYIGIDKTTSNRTNQVLVLTVPAGFYTSIIIKGGFENLKKELYNLHNQIESCGYCIDSLIGYEKIALPKNLTDFDYQNIQRELFVKIKRV